MHKERKKDEMPRGPRERRIQDRSDEDIGSMQSRRNPKEEKNGRKRDAMDALPNLHP
jgi:hypothetical protein